MSIRGILNTARSLEYWLRSQEVTANNLANATSDAFKADRVTARQFPGETYPEVVQQTDLRQGAVRDTGRPLDVALDGPGYLVVRTPEGDRLTRGGSFTLDASGRIADAHGNPILGTQGPIVTTGGSVEVRADGSVREDGALIGRLRLVDLPGEKLRKVGEGRFLPLAAPADAEATKVRVRQGAIEDPNVDPLLGMVDLVSIQRAYAANLDALKAMDGVLGTVVNQVGRVE